MSSQKDQRDSSGTAGIGPRNTFLLRPATSYRQPAGLRRTGPVFAAIRRGKPSGAQRHSRSLDFLNKIDNSSTWCAHSRRGTWNKFLSALPENGSQEIRAGRPISSHPFSICLPPFAFLPKLAYIKSILRWYLLLPLARLPFCQDSSFDSTAFSRSSLL